MITLSKAAYQTQTRIDEYYGKSTDEKPTENINNGSVLYLMDTHQVYMFDADTNSWILQ